MAKHNRRQISEKSALQCKEDDLRRLAAWYENINKYGEPQDWGKQDKEKIINYLQCQLIVSTNDRQGWG